MIVNGYLFLQKKKTILATEKIVSVDKPFFFGLVSQIILLVLALLTE